MARDEQTGEPIDLPARFSSDFNPGDFHGSAGSDGFLRYIGLDEAYLNARGCVLGARIVDTFGVFSCIDFNSDPCPPLDADNDGWPDGFEDYYGSDRDVASSVPELAAIDEQHGTSICSDGIDNDGDGRIDRPDSGCRIRCEDFGLTDLCSDADRDGWLNYIEGTYDSNPKDSASTPETFRVGVTCEDGVDNDLDGRTDGEELGCGGDCIDFDADVSCGPF